MSFTLTGTRYIGVGALPVPVLGYDLVATDTGNYYVANSTATSWILVGSVNSPNLGMLPLTGGTMTGNVAGATGWAPNDSPNFTTTAKLNGVTLATSTDLSTTQTNILNTIAPKISEAVGAVTTGITTAANTAIGTGILTFSTAVAQTIPLPVFSDGTTCPETSCKWVASLIGFGTPIPWVSGFTTGIPCGRADSNGDVALIWSANPLTTRTFYGIIQDRGGTLYPTYISYMIMGYR